MAAGVMAQNVVPTAPFAPEVKPTAAWESKAVLVLTGSYGRTTAGDTYEEKLASAHTDPTHEDLAFGGAELFGSMSQDWATGRLELAAAFHVHRYPGETTESELEEIYAEWSREVFKVRAGIFLTPLGLTNSLHAHTWTFANAPLFYGRFLGSDGLRNPGLQVSWEAQPGASLWTFALQRATGDTAFSFRSSHADAHSHAEEPGHEDEAPSYLGRVHNAALGSGSLVTLRNERAYRFEAGKSLASGVSVSAGDNGTGGSTWIGAWDLEFRRETGPGRWQALELEVLYRDYQALAGVDSHGDPVLEDRLQDLAVALAASATLTEGWLAGLRAERGLPLDRGAFELTGRDLTREARTRFSPLLSWKAVDGVLLRLQYDHDRASSFGTEDSVWLTVQWTFGQH